MEKRAILLIFLLLCLSYAFGDTFSGKAWVIDGDSLRVTLPDLTKREVRLFGIDAPEMSTKAGHLAKRSMIHLIAKDDRMVTCTQVDIDKYGRYVSICKNKNGDIARAMLKQGCAKVYTYFIKKAPAQLRKSYLKAELIANKHGCNSRK